MHDQAAVVGETAASRSRQPASHDERGNLFDEARRCRDLRTVSTDCAEAAKMGWASVTGLVTAGESRDCSFISTFGTLLKS